AVFPDSPQLESNQKETGFVQTLQTLNEFSEAAYVLREIEQGIGGSDMLKASGDKHVREPKDYAVLYRTHRSAKVLQRAFIDAGVPFQIAGEGSPYEQQGIQTIIAVMRYLHSPSDMNKAELAKYLKLHHTALPQIETLLVKYNAKNEMLVCDLAAS